MSDTLSILTDPPKINYQENALSIDVKEAKKLIESRRSIRVFTAKPIPEAVVRECLRWATLAPNSSNLQSWEFYWVRTQEKKNQVIEACFSQSAAKTAQELIVCVARTDTWKTNAKKMLEVFETQSRTTEVKVPPSAIAYYKKLVPFVYHQGFAGIWGLMKRVLYFFVGMTRPVPREPVSQKDMVLWAVKTTALACENLMLAFRAHGFDTCPMEGYDSARVRKILKLPSGATTVMIISAGERASSGVYGPQIRFPIQNFIKEV